MLANDMFTMDGLREYLDKPETKRPFAMYREELLAPLPAFTGEEVARLMAIVRMPTPSYPKHSVSKLLIDLSWASSRLEGNTYTQLDTQALIEYGHKNADKPIEDAAMILNHKRAIEYMLAGPALTEACILQIHAYLADDKMAPDSRHFLVPRHCGVVRSFTPNGLTVQGSTYLPPQAEDRPPGFIDKEFARIVASANSMPDPINQSFYLMTRIPYLQAFYDANKRTSRVTCNIPLVVAGLSPLSFVDFEKDNYIGGMIAFYELGDERMAKGEFLDAYLSSAFRYLNFGEQAKFALSNEREKHLAEARQYVQSGVRGPSPVWLRQQNPDNTASYNGSPSP